MDEDYYSDRLERTYVIHSPLGGLLTVVLHRSAMVVKINININIGT
jgi:hypothetical protein